MKIALIYWSATGNTKKMAEALAEGIVAGGATAEIFAVDEFDQNNLEAYDGFFFGCPAMGDEELEEQSFEPFFAEIEGKLKDKPVGLFGSYGWGDGAWMRIWEQRVKDDGAKLVGEGLIVQNSPDEEATEKCRDFGKTFLVNI